MSEGSITCWLTALEQGEADAAQAIWTRYWNRLVALARGKLRGGQRREADEEDIAQNALDSFFRGVAARKYPQLEDRDNLWRLLVVITARKAWDQLRREASKRQGGGAVQTEAAISPNESEFDGPALQQIIGDEPTPDFAVQVAEEYQCLLALLDDDSLREVVRLKFEAYTNEEIADRMDVSLRTIARKLESIRTLWRQPSET